MRDFDRGRKLDTTLLFTALALWIIGLSLVYSATHIHETGPLAGLARSQVVWIAMGLCIIIIIVSIPMRFFFSFSYVFYAISLAMLLGVLISGHGAKGAERWLAIGPIKIQPSEFAKIGLMFALARYLSKHPVNISRLASFIVPGTLMAVPFLLVMTQPDLGTAMVFCAMAVPMFFWAGMPLLEIFYIASPGLSIVFSAIPLIMAFGKEASFGVGAAIPWGLFFLVICALLYFFRPNLFIVVFVILANIVSATMTNVMWNSFLKDYQKMRIISFINPQMDPFGAGYQVIQSKVAIGSGHIFGKGFLKGSQTRLSYLPEQHTDFIFSVLGEQFGLFGCTIIILLFLFLITRAIISMQHIRNRYTNLLITGSSAILAFHVFINIAMTLGMMPVTGVPLPFLSYGGSFTLTVSIFVGLLLNARISDQEF
jgi:rod shape determining protein RodA